MSQRSTNPTLGRVLAGALLVLGLALGAPLAAQALPPDGPGPETPGTKSRVWPTKVKAGDRLNFEVSGFPANETVYIKIDDGAMCTDTSHGACVYHTQKLNGKGRAKGSLVVPDLAPGKHWLRMLATGDVFDSKTGEKLGYEGYTRRGGNDFTVLEGGSSGKNAGGTAAAPGGGNANSDGSIAGGSISIEIEDEPSPTAEPSTTQPSVEPPATEQPASAAPVAASPRPSAGGTPQPVEASTPAPTGELPVAGIASLAGAVVIGGGAVGWALARRNRLLKRAASEPHGE